jgi:UDP-glucose 4-epimerase
MSLLVGFRLPKAPHHPRLIHVTDLADAHVLALREVLAGGASETFNVGTGLGHSVPAIAAAALRTPSHCAKRALHALIRKSQQTPVSHDGSAA